MTNPEKNALNESVGKMGNTTATPLSLFVRFSNQDRPTLVYRNLKSRGAEIAVF